MLFLIGKSRFISVNLFTTGTVAFTIIKLLFISGNVIIKFTNIISSVLLNRGNDYNVLN